MKGLTKVFTRVIIGIWLEAVVNIVRLKIAHVQPDAFAEIMDHVHIDPVSYADAMMIGLRWCVVHCGWESRGKGAQDGGKWLFVYVVQ